MKPRLFLSWCIAIALMLAWNVSLQAAITSPTDIPGAVLWLDASDSATLTVDGGGMVSSWADKSGQGNTVTQTAGAPQLVQNVLGNGTMDLLRFDGGDALTRAVTSGLPAGNAPRSMFFVANDGGKSASGYVAGYGGTNNNLAFTYDFNMDATTRVVAWNNDYETGMKSHPYSQVWGVQYNGTTVRTFSDYEEGVSSARSYNTQSQNIRIGEWVNGGINFQGDLAEVIIYNGNLTDAQRGDVIAYLENKYFPSVSAVAPVAGPGVAGNVLWLDASDIDGNSLPDSLANRTPIEDWIDKSPSGLGSVTQGDGGKMPSLEMNALGGRPAVRFDGNDWMAGSPVLAAGDDNYTYVAVWEPYKTADVQAVFEQADAAGAIGQRSSILAINGKYGFNGQNDDRHDLVPFGAGQLRVTTMTIDNAQYNNVRIIDNGQTYTGRTDGWVSGVPYGPAELNIGAGSTRVGAKVANNTENVDGDVAEILVYDHALTDEELVQVNNYIITKYGASGAPLHQWTFEDGTARDLIGNADGTLNNGASIVGGRLILDGMDDYLSTTILTDGAGNPETITAKTLVAWVSLDNLTQQGGGAVTIENPIGDDVFDSVVFGEAVAGKWMNGSNFWNRTQNPQTYGFAETAVDPDAVMVAVVYGADNSITVYHDGFIYGQYTIGTLQTYSTANESNVLLGLRHLDNGINPGTPGGSDGFLAGAIDEARVYGAALTPMQIQALFLEGPSLVPEPSALALLGLGLIGLFVFRFRTSRR